MIKNKYYKIGNINKRICLLADIHYNVHYDLSLFDKIIENIKKNKPDYICIPGDIADDADIYRTQYIDKLTKFIKDLSTICPVILVRGNHDEESYLNRKVTYLKSEDYYIELDKNDNIYWLNNKSKIFGDISFTGLEASYEYYHRKTHEDKEEFIKEIDSLTNIDTAKYNVLLSHSPVNTITDLTLSKSKNIGKFELVLSGHMHNGLVFNFLDGKGNRGWIGPYRNFLPKYAKGKTVRKLNDKEITLIVTGAVIKFSEHAPKLLYKLNNLLYPYSIDYIDI